MAGYKRNSPKLLFNITLTFILGAWWLGWIILGFSMLFFAGSIGMFPKHLPKKKVIRDTSETPRMAYVDEDIPFRSSEIHHIANKRRAQEKEESPKMKGSFGESFSMSKTIDIFFLRFPSGSDEASKEQNFDVQYFIYNFLHTWLLWIYNILEQVHGSSIQ